MNFLESLKMAFTNLLSYKMRSFLTMLGIIIGITAVILMSAIGAGAQEKIVGDLNKLGIGNFDVSLDTSLDNIKNRNRLQQKQVDMIKNISGVEAVAPSGTARQRVEMDNFKNFALISGAVPASFNIENTQLLKGRYFNANEYRKTGYFVIVDDVTAARIFGDESPLGKKIKVRIRGLGDKEYIIVGISKNPVASLTGIFGGNSPSFLQIPYQNYQYISKLDEKYFDGLKVKVSDANDLSRIMDATTAILNKEAGIDKLYQAVNSNTGLEQFNSILSMLSVFVSFVASVSLFVGGIGVMNIMLVSVTERIREVGLRKAIGAKNKDILLQFLIEAIILTVSGGLIGIILGSTLALVLSTSFGMVPIIKVSIILISLIVSTLIGVVFGVYPASKAAKLNPIDALRVD
ncbi:MAG: ABC transporter permease [Sebaldella sp.]|nr:ABC transporter permease [Sebaldella sp.]